MLPGKFGAFLLAFDLTFLALLFPGREVLLLNVNIRPLRRGLPAVHAVAEEDPARKEAASAVNRL